MRRVRLFWQVYGGFLGLTVLVLLAAFWLGKNAVRESEEAAVLADLEARARLAARMAEGRLAPPDRAELAALCRDVAARTGTRLTIVAPSGEVLADSHENPAVMDNHGQRPEIQEALAQGFGTAIRYSDTLREQRVYAAVAVRTDGAGASVVRASLPLARLEANLNRLYYHLLAGGAGALAAGALLSWLLARRISGPLERMRQGAERFARGELSVRLAVPDSEETGGLAVALNQMAAQLEERLGTVLRQRNELEAVLSSMAEAVLAVDAAERLISLNDAAGRLFRVDPRLAEGRTIQEVLRHSDLQRFVNRTLAHTEPQEDTITMVEDGERHLQAHGTVLRDARGGKLGALVVLNDITRLKQLEQVRRDFVANVSHELRTPLTTIKGFVETLLDGKPEDAEQTRRILAIVARQTNRLNAIVEDLLTLSQLEDPSQRTTAAREDCALRPLLEEALEVCGPHAARKNIRVTLDCPSEVRARCSPNLIEQAVINLVDNALKYSEVGAQVEVRGGLEGQEALIQIHDTGCGIGQEHLGRVFERFYRVDRARSRNAGGTGLGLSIVKHIMLLHQGRTEVQSQLGKGSVFTLRWPSAAAEAVSGSLPAEAQ